LIVLDKNSSLTHDHGCGCADCACGKRNRFFRGKRMRAGDYAIEQSYGIERRRVINRSVIGWGVVNGFAMSKDRAEVGPGFALDRQGREIVLAHAATPGPGNLFVLDESGGGCRPRGLETLGGGQYVLSVHYAERRFGEANLPASCGCDDPEENYVCETAVFSLRSIAGNDCPCGDEPCSRPCDCTITDSCGRPVKGEAPGRSAGRGSHACVCHWLMDDPVTCDPPRLCEWSCYEVDPCDGVPIACVVAKPTGDRCKPVMIEVRDPCGPRRFVKSNDLLYDFIRGCDLTHISWVSWAGWHRSQAPVPWPDFAGRFNPDDGRTEFVVRFSGPVRKDTIRWDSIVMRAALVEQSTSWQVIRQVPIPSLDLTPYGPVPGGMTDQVRVYVSTDWIYDEVLKDRPSWLTDREFSIEIEVYGDGILDCHDQPIDGEALGAAAAPSGNGSPGGTYRSSFRVAPKPRP
jgi:hypothetical protein